jgi:hypothetical protein
MSEREVIDGNFAVALRIAAQGHYVFPCHPGGEEVKRPFSGVRWRSQSTNDARAVERFWRAYPGAAVAIDLAKSGLVVIDAYRHGTHDGVEAFGNLMAEHGFDPDAAPIVATPNQGNHHYFRQPEGMQLGNKRGALPPGIDVRGHGGFVIAPGTVLEDGRTYEQFGDLAAAPVLPAWLVNLIGGTSRPEPAPAPVPVQRQQHSDARIRAYVDAAVAAETARVASAGEGGRNHALNQAAFSLGQLVGAGWIGEAEVAGLLTSAAWAAGLKQPEIRLTIRSGIGAGRHKPRELHDLPEDPTLAEQARILIERAGVLHDAETGEVVDLTPLPAPSTIDYPAGLVGDLARWIAETARRPQPELSIGAALAIVGTAAGRQYGGPTMSGTHLYILGLAPTGKGKDHPLQSIGRVMTAAKLGAHLGPSEFISMPALVNFIARRPLSVCAMDEFGAFMKRINSKRASGFEGAISKIIRTMWSASFAPYATPEWAQKESVNICAPSLTLYGASTPEQFYAAMEGASIEDGTLNRFLIIQGRDRAAERDPLHEPGKVPEDIISRLQGIYGVAGLMGSTWRNDPNTDPLASNAVRRLEWCADGSQARYEAFLAEIEAKSDADPFAAAFWARTAEMALRIATVIAIGRLDDLQVRIADLEYGIELARVSAQIMQAGAAEYMSENYNQANAQKVLRIIKQRGGRIRRTEMLHALKHQIRARDLNELLSAMVESGHIERQEVSSEGGRPATFYRIL